MVFTARASRSVRIEALPDKVRAQFLDFGNLLRWSPENQLFRSIRPKKAGTEDPIDAVNAQPGDSLTIATSTGLAPRIDGKLIENSERAFRYSYQASGYSVTHSFEFKGLLGGGKETVLTQSMTLHGLWAWQYFFWWPARWILDGRIDGFNDDIKQAVEDK